MTEWEEKLESLKNKIESNHGIDRYFLYDAYDSLRDIIQEHPDSAPEVFANFRKAVQHEENDDDSLQRAYEILGDLLKEYPNMAPEVFKTFRLGLQNKHNAYFASRYYYILSSMINTQPEWAPEVFTIFKEGLPHPKNDLADAYSVLFNVMEQHPNLASETFDLLQYILQDPQNTVESLRYTYNILEHGDLISRPDLVQKVSNFLKQVLENEKDDANFLLFANNSLMRFSERHQNLLPNFFDVIKMGIQHKNNDYNSLIEGYSLLANVVKAQPNLAPEVFETFKIVLQNEQNNTLSLGGAYSALADITKKQPELATEVFETFKIALQNEGNDRSSLERAYFVLADIAKKQPDLAPQVFETFKIVLQNKNNNSDTLKYTYSKLDNILEEQPNLSSEVLAMFTMALQNENNNSDTLGDVYSKLDNIIKGQPNLPSEVLETFTMALQNENNNRDTLKKAYSMLANIVKKQPDFAPEVFEILKQSLQNESNTSDSLKIAYSTLGDIVQLQPDLAPEVIKIVFQKKFSDVINSPKLVLEVCSKCMKRHKPEDFAKDVEQTEQNMQMLQAGYKMRFSTKEEFDYAYENYALGKIGQMNFSAQQRCMNVMVGQLGKEQKLPAEDVNQYRKDANNTTYQSNRDWLVSASFNAAEIFGCYFPAYVKSTEKHLSTHDAVYWLPKDLPENKRESFRSFVQRNLIYDDTNGQRKARSLAEMEIISKNWKYLKPEDEKLKYKDILAICQSRKYTEQEYDKFAAEAAKWGVSESEYKNWESVYQAGLKVPEPFDSSKEFKFGKYTGKFLPREDVRTGFFGGYTDCCQHFNGVGSACAISTVKDPYSQLFVIENEQGRIVAGSWVWENTEGKYRDVCFDNIEAIGEYAQNPLVNKIYDMAGRYLTEEANCHKVTIGLGYQDADVSKYKETAAIPLPTQYNDNYSDAKGTQVLLTENPKAKPLDKAQESTRFIRDVCFLDINEMDKVSEQCFPEGDDRLQAPEKMSGLALVDADKGVVGYCLYDKEEKSIYDMAVLPEYRTDKNASSKKLFGELIRRVRDMGGEWSAELRDKTTYRYLDVMSQRGLVTFENHGVDHEMSDGSKVYSVTFSVPKKEQSSQSFAHIKDNDGRE